MRKAVLSVFPAFSLAVTIVLVLAFGLFQGSISNPPNLLLTLNLIFITGTNIAVAIISARSYLKERSSNLLALGCALLVSGLTALTAGWASGFSVNGNVTIFNIGILVASCLQVLGAFLTLSENPSLNLASEKSLLVVSYSAVVAFALLISAIAVDGLFPIFFTSAGPTLLRQVVLGFAATLFSFAFLVYVRLYFKSKSIVLLFYLLGLGAISMGLFGSLFVTQFTGILAWLTRLGQYMGGLYFLTAAISLTRGKDQGLDFSGRWTEAFRSDQRQLETLFSKMLNGFSYNRIIVDHKGKPVDYIPLAVNDAFEKMTGLKRKKVIGNKVTEILPGVENDPADWIGIYGKVALTGQPVTFENYAVLLNKWYSVSAYSPRKGYFVAIFEDITERKSAEGKILDMARFPSENPNPVLRIARDGTLIYSNNAAKQACSWLKGEVDATIPDSWRQLLNEITVLKEKKNFEVQLGENVFSFVISPVADYVNVYGHDITERKKAEQALKQSEERFSKAFHGSPFPIVIARIADNQYVDVNESFLNILEFNKEEVIGHTSKELNLFPNYAEREEFVRILLKQGIVRNQEIDMQTKTGKQLKVVFSAEIIVIDDQKHLISSFIDITQRKQLQKQVEEYTQNLEKIIEERTKQLKDAERLATIGATAGMVGHDIRNPLQAIVGDIYLTKSDAATLPESPEKQSIQENLEAIEQNVGYINKIVVDLQDYAKPLNPVAKETDLEVALKEALQEKNLPKNIQASYHIEENAGKIFTDADLLKRILDNLVLNAIQAMPDGGKLFITSSKQSEDTILTVEDTGVGIHDDIKPKLFTPMFTTKSKGQGFGLAVVKRVTEALGGTISFESELGNGTKFIVRLPAPKEISGKWIFK